MKIRNTLFENKQYFETIGKIHESDQLSVMDAYRINRLVKKLNELNEEYMELKKKLLDQFGTPGEEEGQFAIEGDQREPFTKEMNDLISIEHDLETEMLAFPRKADLWEKQKKTHLGRFHSAAAGLWEQQGVNYLQHELRWITNHPDQCHRQR